MREEVRDIDGFDWEFVDETYEGITLKHAFDMNCQYAQVQYESECPTPFVEPYFRDFIAKGHNDIDKLDPENGHEMPEHWFDWHSDISCSEFKKLPYKQTVVKDLHHTAIDPAPMQPSRTRNRAHYSIYFLSPRKIVIFVRTEGFDYTFCDRFQPE